jgi:flagellar export protein FliJ
MESRRLKRILEIKRRIEQARKGDLAVARDEYDAAQMSLLSAQAEQRARVAALAEEAEISVDALLDRARFVELAGEQLGQARAALADRHTEVAQREEAMVHATREVRTFEILNEREREEQRVAARNAEQRSNDDIVSSRRSRS